MKISVIIPVYNEEETVKRTICAIQKVNLDKEIIVVDDKSEDLTYHIIEEMKYSNLILIKQDVHQGKGAAIRKALEYINGEIVIIQDADLEYDPSYYHKLIEPILKNQAKVVYGSRFKGKRKGMRFSNLLANKILTWVTNILFGIHITDEATCYKVFRADVIKKIPLKCNGFEFCPEVTAKIAKRGIAIVEVPISYQARTVAEGKKVKWIDGFIAIYTLIKYRFMD